VARGRALPQLRALRTERLLTQEALAVLAQVSPATVNRIESKGAPADLATIRKLADALGVSPVALMRDPDRR
jgi:transcriptional regulator with XRE-family HTH domain